MSWPSVELVDFNDTTAGSAPTFVGFLKARNYTTTSKPSTYPTMPKRGTIADARDGVDCNMLRAFNDRCKPIILKADVEIVEASIRQHKYERKVDFDPNCIVKASSNMEYRLHVVTKEWIANVVSTFYPLNETDPDSYDVGQLQTDSDGLFSCLQVKMQRFHSQNKCKPTHWVWSFSRANLSRVCSIIVMMRWQVATPLRHRDKEHVSLFAPVDESRSTQKILWDKDGGYTSDSREYEGVYLVYDKEKSSFVRTGKTETKFAERLKAHETGSWLTTEKSRLSKFYLSYPSQAKAHPDLHDEREGYYENLVYYIGLGIKRRDWKFLVEEKESAGAIFEWTFPARQSLARSSTVEQLRREKKLALIEYMVEHVYELMAIRFQVVSESQGFESYMKAQERKKTNRNDDDELDEEDY